MNLGLKFEPITYKGNMRCPLPPFSVSQIHRDSQALTTPGKNLLAAYRADGGPVCSEVWLLLPLTGLFLTRLQAFLVFCPGFSPESPMGSELALLYR